MEQRDSKMLDDRDIGGRSGETLYHGYAGFWNRVFARLIDGLALYLVAFLVYNSGTEEYPVAIRIGINSLALLYQPLMEWKYGATLGKMALGMKVTDYGFKSLSLEQAFIRSIFYISNYIHALIIDVSFLLGGNPNPATSITEMLNNPDHYFENLGMYGYLAVFIGLVTMVSCIWVAADERKQALHDKVAKTYCLSL